MSNAGNHLGYGGAALALTVQELYPGLDPLLLQRKGRLILLVTQEADRDALAWLCRAFYDSRSYDPIPTLVRCLAQLYRDRPGMAEILPLAIVLRGLELNMVGTDHAVVRLVRYGVVRDLFNAQAPKNGLRVAMARQPTSPQIAPLYSAQWRLVTGDALLLTVQAVAERVGPGALQRILKVGGTPNRAAALLARLPRVPEEAPILVMRQGEFSPVPEMPGIKPPAEEQPPIPRPKRRGLSPIWVALLIAVVAIAGTFWATDLHLNIGELDDYLMMLFFPPAQATPTLEPTTAEPFASPTTPLPYAAPSLIHPYPGARLQGAEIVLSWDWPEALAPDEFYQVILWPPEEEPVYTLTRAQRHIASIGADGWYSWSVRIVNAADRDAPIPLSPQADPVSFHWSAE